jgi:uncharacterized protein (TIGR02594 family)
MGKLKEGEVPQWLEVMRAITGLTEEPGEADNPKIVGMREVIARAYPEMRSYCDLYEHDSTAWCGLAAAACVTVAGYRPPFGATDTDKFLWAQSFASDPGFEGIDTPRVGAIVVMTREGGGHVTMYEGKTNGSISCRGGNQSDCVCVSNYDPNTVIGYYWPKGAPLPPAPRRTISEGDSGQDVAECQRILGIPVDGDFGPTTDGAVKGFQAGADLVADGEVGPLTWEALDDLDLKKKQGDSGLGLSSAQVDTIANLARSSAIAQYSWDDRGRSPVGYVVGMALSYAVAVTRLNNEEAAFKDMAQADRGDPDEDVLSWYEDELEDMEWDTSENGVETLRALFAIMIGLGMRESSGRYCEGRDMSASNVSSDTAEAGLFQTSWNIRSCSANIGPLLDDFWADPNGFLDQFREGVSPSGSDLSGYGSPEGATYQFLSKYAPAFHVYVTALGLRHLRQHWGPINRNEVELVEEAYALLSQIEEELETEPEPGPEPEMATVTIQVTPMGSVDTSVNGLEVPSTAPGLPKVEVDIATRGQVEILIDGHLYVEGRLRR